VQLSQSARFAGIRRPFAHRHTYVFLRGDVKRYHQYSFDCLPRLAIQQAAKRNDQGGALRSDDNHESRLTQFCNVRRMVQDGLLLPVVFLLPVLDDLRSDHLLTQQTNLQTSLQIDKPTTLTSVTVNTV